MHLEIKDIMRDNSHAHRERVLLLRRGVMTVAIAFSRAVKLFQEVYDGRMIRFPSRSFLPDGSESPTLSTQISYDLPLPSFSSVFYHLTSPQDFTSRAVVSTPIQSILNSTASTTVQELTNDRSDTTLDPYIVAFEATTASRDTDLAIVDPL